MKKLMRKTKAAIRTTGKVCGAFVLSSDLPLFAGVWCVGYGTWQIYPPAAWIVTGALLIGAAVLAARRGK